MLLKLHVLCMNLYCRPCSTYLVGGNRVGADMRMMMLLNSAHAVLMPYCYYIYLGNGIGWSWYGLAGSTDQPFLHVPLSEAVLKGGLPSLGASKHTSFSPGGFK